MSEASLGAQVARLMSSGVDCPLVPDCAAQRMGEAAVNLKPKD